jgi:predicted amidohydrolase
MLIISQERWHTGDLAGCESVLKAALETAGGRAEAVMCLLPLGESDWSALPEEAELVAALGTTARHCGAYIATAAPVMAEHSGVAQTIGFVVDPDGNCVLRTPKISPDFLEAYSDSTCELGRPADLPVIETPLGRVGMLVNEDVLASPYARTLAYNGAELILNPAREIRDTTFESRQRARATRAYENSAYVAVATPREVCRGGFNVQLPTASALYCFDEQNFEQAGSGESFLITNPDPAHLRTKRGIPFFNQPVYLRTAVYAQGLRALAGEMDGQPMPETRAGWQARAGELIEARAARDSQALPSETIDRYGAILVQNEFRVVQPTTPDPARILSMNLEEAIGLAARNAADPNIKLVCFPEFFMSGPGPGQGGVRTAATLERIAITYPGPELDRLSEFATTHGVYVAGSTYEKDPNFPGRVFNSAFILNDSGDLIHRYRKIHCADIWGILPDTTPGSIFTEYVDTYGYDALFPIVDTPIGRLATMVCFDHTVPETARMLAQRGAEVIIHCTSDPHGAGRRSWEECRMTRAYENSAYILAPRPGGEYFDPEDTHPGTFLRGYTRIIGFDGRLLGEADTSGRVGFNAFIDLAALRKHRADISANMLIWDDPRVYAHVYESGHGLPNDLWAGDPAENPYTGFKQMLAVLDRYYDSGIYLRPDAAKDDENDRTQGVADPAPM